MLNILTVLLYYDRPDMVRPALESVLRAGEKHPNWTLAVSDDGSPTPVLPIVREVMAGHLDKVRVFRSDMTPDEKKANGCYVGLAMNHAIQNSPADIGLILCDDDRLHEDYFVNLDDWFTAHPDEASCYSHVVTFNPVEEHPDMLPLEASDRHNTGLNRFVEPINCCCKVDASQVAWRLSCNKDHGVWFKYPAARDHDAHFFDLLYRRCGPTPFSGFVSQYKGVHDNQLGKVGPEAAWSSHNGGKA